MQGLSLVALARSCPELSKTIWFIKFGSVDNFPLNFEFHQINRTQLNGKILFELKRPRGKRYRAGPGRTAQHAGCLAGGTQRSVGIKNAEAVPS